MRSPVGITKGLKIQPILEVERKFSPTPTSIAQLRAPSFKAFNLTIPRKTKFLDEYYDRDKLLLQKKMWLRKRTYTDSTQSAPTSIKEVWELKVRQGGNFTNSSFMEVVGHDEIVKFLKNSIEEMSVDHQRPLDVQVGLTAKFVTERESWWANDRFKITIDEADFGHVVGEVELEERLSEAYEAGSDKARLEELHKEIESFMVENQDVFPREQTPVGKLSAYFKKEKKLAKKAGN